MAENVKGYEKSNITKEMGETIEALGIPINELRVNLRKVAESRGLAEANLQLCFSESGESHLSENEEAIPSYYNVYRYAFFGMVPDKEFYSTTKATENIEPSKKE